MDVSIIIVNYNTRDLTVQCLESIYKNTKDVEYEIIVVDNASIDDSCKYIKEKFPKVLLIQSNANLGFGRANNLGVKKATGKYFFFLNSDCLLIENTIKLFFDFMESNNQDGSIGAIGALLFDINMNLNTSFNRFPTIGSEIKLNIIKLINKLFNINIKNPLTSNYKMLNQVIEVDSITGADMFLTADVFRLLKGFDERFFLYYEETDLQKRMVDFNLKRLIFCDYSLIHLGGSSSKKDRISMNSQTIAFDSMYKYFKKHSSKTAYFVFCIAITILLIPKLFLSSYSIEERKRFLKMLLRKKSH